MTPNPRRLAVAAAVSLAASLGTGSANAQLPPLVITADAAHVGKIDLYVVGTAGASVVVGESVGGRDRPLRTVILDESGLAILPEAVRWRCDRKLRRFIAATTPAAGPGLHALFTLRTPSCRTRLALAVPRAASPQTALPVAVRDRWELGGAPARLCALPPGRRARCHRFRLPGDGQRFRTSFTPRSPGRWRIELRSLGLRVVRTVNVSRSPQRRTRKRLPLVLVTGDSMMQSLDFILSERLRGRARVLGDTHVATGLSKLNFDWLTHAQETAIRLRPTVTIVFVGANDGFPMTTPAGVGVICCGEPWVTEYARRAQVMMSAYARDGAGRVLWLLLPAPKGTESRRYFAAVNQALLLAAEANVPGASLVRLDDVFTPDFVYREFMDVGTGREQVRAEDGMHLSVPGTRLAASILEDLVGLP